MFTWKHLLYPISVYKNSPALSIQKRRTTDKPIKEPVNKRREIVLLIASDFYFSVVKDVIIQLNYGAVAEETKVGILSVVANTMFHRLTITSQQHKQLSM